MNNAKKPFTAEAPCVLHYVKCSGIVEC